MATESTLSAAIASGVKEGETVIAQADMFKDRIGEAVEVADA